MTHLIDLDTNGYKLTGAPGTRGPGRCASCGHKIVRGDDWTIHPTLATC